MEMESAVAPVRTAINFEVIPSLPKDFDEFLDSVEELIYDADSSFDPQRFINDYTMREATRLYTTDEIMVLHKILRENHIATFIPDGSNTPIVNIGFDFVHLPQPNKHIKLPQRSTSGSAGYDFVSPCDFIVTPDKPVCVKTGIKAIMPQNVNLDVNIRSGLSRSLVLANNVGIIDSDYQFAKETNGEIMVTLLCQPNVDRVEIKAGDRLVQGIFREYLTVDIDVPRSNVRVGGHGSTGK